MMNRIGELHINYDLKVDGVIKGMHKLEILQPTNVGYLQVWGI